MRAIAPNVPIIQLRAKQTAHLVNKHYQNEVTLTGKNEPLESCQPLEILAPRKMGLDLFYDKNMGSVGQRAAKLLAIKL